MNIFLNFHNYLLDNLSNDFLNSYLFDSFLLCLCILFVVCIFTFIIDEYNLVKRNNNEIICSDLFDGFIKNDYNFLEFIKYNIQLIFANLIAFPIIASFFIIFFIAFFMLVLLILGGIYGIILYLFGFLGENKIFLQIIILVILIKIVLYNISLRFKK